MSWETIVRKFEGLTAVYATASLQHEIADAVASLEKVRVADLTALLARVQTPART
jgi:hypothetical protein